MNQVVEKAEKRLAEVEAEAEELRAFIRVYRKLSGQKSVDGVSVEEGSTVDESYASPAQIVAAARQAMRDHGRPLSRSKLVKILEGKGLKIGGTDKAKNLGTVIWRSKGFDNIGGEGYWPKDFEGWIGQRVRGAEATII